MDNQIPIFTGIKKTRLIFSNGFLNMLILFNTFLNRLIAIVKMMVMCLNKFHIVFLIMQISKIYFIKTKTYL